MPIHEKLRGSDFPTIRNYLRVTLCNIHDEFTKRLDAAAVAAALRGDQYSEDFALVDRASGHARRRLPPRQVARLVAT